MNRKRVTGKVLGELESQVMEIIWGQKREISVKDASGVLNKKRRIAYTTVMTIMTRLVGKGILDRRLSGTSYFYKPKVSKEKFIARAVHSIFSASVSSLGEGVLAYFVKEIQKISPKKRRELLKILGGEQ